MPCGQEATVDELIESVGKTLEELRILPQAQWERIVAFANAAGSLTTAAKGAIPAMPAREQILRLCGE